MSKKSTKEHEGHDFVNSLCPSCSKKYGNCAPFNVVGELCLQGSNFLLRNARRKFVTMPDSVNPRLNDSVGQAWRH